MNIEAKKRVSKARTDLVLDEPFFGNLALRLKIVETPELPTAWTDGTRLGYNPDFVMSLNNKAMLGLMAHEILHVALGHPWRRNSRNPKKWNYACDYAINPIIVEAGFELPEGGLIDAKYKGKSAEWIYDRLPEPPEGWGNAPSMPGEVGDAGTDPVDGEAPMTEEEWKVAVQEAANSAQKRGELPGGLKRFAEDRTQPKVNWRAALWRFVQEKCKADYAWMYPNRRFLSHGLYLPSLHSEELGHLACYVDISGSIDGVTLAQFSSELNAIVSSVKPRMVTVLYIDTKVRKITTFERDQPITLEAMGGGGTNFSTAFDSLSECEEDPVAIVFLTDGYTVFPEDISIPTLWAMTTDIVAPFGETVRIED